MYDLKYAVRQLVRSPLFTLVSAVSVGIGITVAVTIFSLVNFDPVQAATPAGHQSSRARVDQPSRARHLRVPGVRGLA